jgi:hypothetical protein
MPDITVSGPLFDGRAAKAVKDFLDDAAKDVAAQALADVQTTLNASIKNPTPYYETQINVEKQGDAQVVNDRGVIYGPWLEGTSSRNSSTRFKGYSAFRRAAQSVEGKVTGLVERALAHHLGRMQ